MPRILAICAKEFPGVNAVFKHGASLGYWTHIHLEDPIPEHDILLLGAWHPKYWSLLELKTRYGVYITSTLGQMEFSYNSVELHQLKALQDLLRSGKLNFILAGWPDIADLFAGFGNTFHCPYPFDESIIVKYKSGQRMRNSVGIFLPASPRKNTANQLMAARLSGTKRIFTNLPVGFSPEVERVGWLPEDKYFKLMSEVGMTLHCTFTESFSYGAAESLVLGTIPIVSMQVAENLGLISQAITCNQCDSISKIKQIIRLILNISDIEYNSLARLYLAKLRCKLRENYEITKRVLDKIGAL